MAGERFVGKFKINPPPSRPSLLRHVQDECQAEKHDKLAVLQLGRAVCVRELLLGLWPAEHLSCVQLLRAGGRQTELQIIWAEEDYSLHQCQSAETTECRFLGRRLRGEWRAK